MKLTDAEWLIMNALWIKSPATAREVADRLPARVTWAYTTIKTMLSRLVAKKIVAEEKRGKASVYEPLMIQSKARKGALKSFVDSALGGAVGPLVHYLAEEKQLSEKQRRQLEEILQEEES